MTTAVQGFLRPAAVGTSGPCKVSMNGGTEKQLGGVHCAAWQTGNPSQQSTRQTGVTSIEA